MSRNGMGGKEYDDLLEGIEQHPREMPAVLVCPDETLNELIKQFQSRHDFAQEEHGYVGRIMGISVWVDNRFDQPVFISGL